MKQVYWHGEVERCGHCRAPISKEPGAVMFDAQMRGGGWGNVCSDCHKSHGIGLGLGRGQKYVKQDDGRWLKVEG